MFRPRRKFLVEPQALELKDCYAKTRRSATGSIVLGQTVLTHCCQTGLVAKALLDCLPSKICQKWFPKGTLIAVACHDNGKISPTFQEKLRRATTDYCIGSIQELKLANPDAESQWSGHSGAGQVSAREWTSDERLCAIFGCHHGYFPHTGCIRADSPVLGGPAWQAQRTRLVESLKSIFKSGFPVVQSDIHAKVLTGLTSVADWIASSEQLSVLDDASDKDATIAVEHAGFFPVKVRPNLSFEDIFGFAPNAVQKAISQQCRSPGIYVLEAPMGVGKTEAALYAAYQMLASGQATGLYFALPTQATSNAIFRRANAFLKAIIPEKSPYLSAKLIHSKADLVLGSMGAEAGPGGSWFSSKKRAILFPFGVGTIDQALMSVMAVRHSTVRMYGLLGKVVILDEVHSYDLYTGTILDALVKALRALDCTVIILSATLTKTRREALLQTSAQSEQYPLLSSMSTRSINAFPIECPIFLPLTKTVHTRIISERDLATKEVVTRAKEGQQILWIENTVEDAQQTYDNLLAYLCKFPQAKVEIGLLHSRFTAADREANEAYWLNVLGKGQNDIRNRNGRILVGTQVLEQSLDIDADFLVTNVCPTDMLLQRIGRLWRHPSTKRPDQCNCEAWIIAPDLNTADMESVVCSLGKTAKVYAPYILCRTLGVWQNRQTVHLPEDIRSLLEDTYRERSEEGVLLRLQTEIEEGTAKRKGARQLRQLAQLSLCPDFGTISDDADSNAVTRYSQIPTVDVLLIKAFHQDSSGTVITTLGDITLQLRTNPTHADAAILARKLSNEIVRTPISIAPSSLPSSNLAWLSSYLYVSRIDQERIRIGLVDTTGRILSLSGNQAFNSNCKEARYTKTRGYSLQLPSS